MTSAKMATMIASTPRTVSASCPAPPRSVSAPCGAWSQRGAPAAWGAQPAAPRRMARAARMCIWCGSAVAGTTSSASDTTAARHANALVPRIAGSCSRAHGEPQEFFLNALRNSKRDGFAYVGRKRGRRKEGRRRSVSLHRGEGTPPQPRRARICRGQGSSRLAPQGRARRKPPPERGCTQFVCQHVAVARQGVGRVLSGSGGGRSRSSFAPITSAGAALCACVLACSPHAAQPPPHTS